MMSAVDSVEIPGPLTFWRTYDVPPIQVRIPLVAHTRTAPWLCYAIVFSVFGASSLLAGLMLIYGTLYSNHDSFSLWQSTVLAASALLFLYGAFYLFATAATCVSDAFREDPVLEIGMTGFRERRLDFDASWDSIEHVDVVFDSRRWAGLRLRTKQPVDVRRNPFRLGTRFKQKRPGYEIAVSLVMLDITPYILQNTIAALVERHGSSADVSKWN